MSSPFPCNNPPSTCETSPNPATSFSSEAPDSTTFIGLAWNNQLPALNKPFTVVPCESITQSQLSQADADITAANQVVSCSNPCAPTFSNTAQTAFGTCADGSTYSLTIPAGIFTTDNQVLADRKAFTAAVAALRGHSVCLGGLAPAVGCRGEFYFAQILVITTDTPVSILLVAGQLPDGLEMIIESDRAVVQGTPTTFGSAQFSLQATSSVGVVTTKTYVVNVTGIVTDGALADGTVGQDYSAQLTAVVPAGTTATWSLVDGTLPDGLSLNADTGEISGTPTTVGDSSFTIGATAAGVTCTKDFTMTVQTNSDICNDGIAALLPNTYAINGYFDGMIDNSASAPSGFALWNGTFIFFFGDGIPNDGSTGWGNGGTVDHFSIQHNQACSAQLLYEDCIDGVPQWTLRVSDINDAALWQGSKVDGQTPEGVYTLDFGSSPGPATITIFKLAGPSSPETGALFCSS